MKDWVTIEASRTTYSAKDILDRTMTVGELIAMLEEFDEDTPIIISNDNGYTYGGIHAYDIGFDSIEEEDEDNE